MNLEEVLITDATCADAQDILELYTPYITNTAITFEEHVPTLEEFKTRIEHTCQTYPYLVCRHHPKIIGYAYAGPLKTRDAFARSVELSIYLDPNQTHQGLGKKLYTMLFERLKAQNIVSVYAAIAGTSHPSRYLDDNSLKFHAHLGFKETGIFPNCATKFGEWFDLVWMYKDLTSRANTTADSKLFISQAELKRSVTKNF